MKLRIVFLVFTLAAILSSCSHSSDVVSKGFIQKRKYLKGFRIDRPFKKPVLNIAQNKNKKHEIATIGFESSIDDLKNTESENTEFPFPTVENQSERANFSKLNSGTESIRELSLNQVFKPKKIQSEYVNETIRTSDDPVKDKDSEERTNKDRLSIAMLFSLAGILSAGALLLTGYLFYLFIDAWLVGFFLLFFIFAYGLSFASILMTVFVLWIAFRSKFKAEKLRKRTRVLTIVSLSLQVVTFILVTLLFGINDLATDLLRFF